MMRRLGGLAEPVTKLCLLMLVEEKIISWNCIGASSREFVCEMNELMRNFKQKIIVLIEPRVSGEVANRICKKLGRKKWIRAESWGFSGGIWVLWEEEEISLRLLAAKMYFLHMEVVSANKKKLVLIAVYASPKPSGRQFLRSRLEELNVDLPWVLIGDFNCVLMAEERSSRSGVSSSFKSWVDRNGLINLGFYSSHYTWTHGSSVEMR